MAMLYCVLPGCTTLREMEAELAVAEGKLRRLHLFNYIALPELLRLYEQKRYKRRKKSAAPRPIQFSLTPCYLICLSVNRVYKGSISLNSVYCKFIGQQRFLTLPCPERALCSSAEQRTALNASEAHTAL
jgi:hypothetical protein